MRNPRINVTVTPEQHELLRRVAEANGMSVSKVVGTYLEPICEALPEMIAAIEQAQRLDEQMRSSLADPIGEVSQAAAEHHAKFASLFNDLMSDLDRFENEPARSADGRLGAGEDATPGSVTTGVTVHSKLSEEAVTQPMGAGDGS